MYDISCKAGIGCNT